MLRFDGKYRLRLNLVVFCRKDRKQFYTISKPVKNVLLHSITRFGPTMALRSMTKVLLSKLTINTLTRITYTRPSENRSSTMLGKAFIAVCSLTARPEPESLIPW